MLYPKLNPLPSTHHTLCYVLRVALPFSHQLGWSPKSLLHSPSFNLRKVTYKPPKSRKHVPKKNVPTQAKWRKKKGNGPSIHINEGVMGIKVPS
ncbi:hypothetical protein VIGAN_05242700 [Vigna angularis var. angularis]|uniref:Uncharacterized protein n=1 Tax=Vigna angularis var. angularis TaxID=157739 RepID=A0A0S3S7N8_PHAAN|nr:hypothetical protein VIGAN_05242700 [Vigna angularis var. angularis]